MATTIERDVTKTGGREPRATAPENGVTTTAAPGGRRRIVFLALGVVLLLLIAGGVRKLIWSRTHETTDDAQVDGHMLPISPKVGGFVAEVRIVDNQRVKAGDTLVVLDDRDFRARLEQTEADYAALLATISSRSRVGQAEAQVRQAEATARKAHADLDRLLPLAQQDIVSKQQLDAAQAAVAAADAQLAAAQAALVGADARVAAARNRPSFVSRERRAASVRSESLTICPRSAASLAAQRFNSTNSPGFAFNTAVICASEAATRSRLSFASSETEIADSWPVAGWASVVDPNRRQPMQTRNTKKFLNAASLQINLPSDTA